jgi:hypothetical protein
MTDNEIRMLVSKERARDLILDDLISAQEGDLRAMRDTLAHFVVNGTGDYLPQDDYTVEESVEGQEKPNVVTMPGARTLIGRLRLGQLQTYSAQLQTQLRERAVPPATGTPSGNPSGTD